MSRRPFESPAPISWLHVAGFVVVLWAASSEALAQARDMVVTEVRGTAMTTSAARAQPVRPFDAVKAGDRLRLSSDSQVSVFNAADAALYVVDGPAEIVIRAGGVLANGRAVEPRQLDAAYRNLRTASDSLVQGSMVMRGSPRVRLAGPEGLVTDSQARRFRWTGDEAAWALEISTEDGQRIHRADVRGQEYVLPDTIALAPGAKYVWGIAPLGGDAPALDWTEFAIEPAPLGRSDAGRALYAALLQERGLRHAAQRVLEANDAR